MKRLFGSLALMMSMAAGHCSMMAHENTVAGAWTLTTADMSLHMVLAQEGTAVSGKLESPHGPILVSGEFVDPRLTFAGKIEGQPHAIHVSATGTAQANGSLAGTLTTEIGGDMSWTAVRISEK